MRHTGSWTGSCHAHPTTAAGAAGLFPDEQTLEAVAGQLLTEDIATLLERVASEARLEGRYFMCRQDGILEIAALLQGVQGLSLKVRAASCAWLVGCTHGHLVHCQGLPGLADLTGCLAWVGACTPSARAAACCVCTHPAALVSQRSASGPWPALAWAAGAPQASCAPSCARAGAAELLHGARQPAGPAHRVRPAAVRHALRGQAGGAAGHLPPGAAAGQPRRAAPHGGHSSGEDAGC